MSVAPLASVVIPNLNSPAIGLVLEAIRVQAAGKRLVEVLVVGRDEPRQVRPDELVRFLESERPLTPAQARNRGLAAARGQILLFLDADCVPDAHWLERLLARYEDPDVHVVGGSMALAGASFWKLADNVTTFHQYLCTLPAGTRELFASFNLSCRRQVLEKVGGFDEAYPFAGEDADLTLRMSLAGYRLHFEPTAVVYHDPQRSGFRSMLARAYKFGQYSAMIDPRYADRLRVPWPLRGPWRLLAAAPLVAGGVTGRAFYRDRHLCRYWRIAPVMFVAKLAWCAGAARTLQRGAEMLAPRGTILRVAAPAPGPDSSPGWRPG